MKKGKRWYCDSPGCGREIPESKVEASAELHYCGAHRKAADETAAALNDAMRAVGEAVNMPQQPEVRIVPIDGKMQATIIPEGEESKQYNLCAQCSRNSAVCDAGVILSRIATMTGVQIIVASCPKHPKVEKYLSSDK